MDNYKFYEGINAQEWAEAFVNIRQSRLAQDGMDIASDEATMIGWFANAIEKGRSHDR